MKTTFYVLLTMRTPTGYENFGRFFIGNDELAARRVFGTLLGTSEVKEDNMLFFELMETRNGLPVNLKVLACTLPQLAENCRMITKEIFKLLNQQNSNELH